MSTPIRFALIVIIFVAAGPPLGALTFSLVGYAGARIIGEDTGTAELLFYGGLIALAASWLIGGLQTVFAGAIAAAAKLFTSIPPVIAAAGAGLVAGLFHVLRVNAEPSIAALLIVVHIVPAAICGRGARAV